MCLTLADSLADAVAAGLRRIGDLTPGDDRGRARLEAAVLDLLEKQTESPALSQLVV